MGPSFSESALIEQDMNNDTTARLHPENMQDMFVLAKWLEAVN